MTASEKSLKELMGFAIKSSVFDRLYRRIGGVTRSVTIGV